MAGMVAASTTMRKVGKEGKQRKEGLMKPNGASADGWVTTQIEKRIRVTSLCRRRQIWIVRAHLCDIRIC